MTHISLRNNAKLSNLTVREFLCIQTEYKIDSKPRKYTKRVDGRCFLRWFFGKMYVPTK